MDNLKDELEFLNELLIFFRQIKYEVMVFKIEKRIIVVQKKISRLSQVSEPIY
jgi:hypothetical protein